MSNFSVAFVLSSPSLIVRAGSFPARDATKPLILLCAIAALESTLTSVIALSAILAPVIALFNILAVVTALADIVVAPSALDVTSPEWLG